MNKERLNKLVDLLENLPKEREKLNYGMDIPTDFDLAVWYEKSPCGTSACAIGHAMLHPWFYEQGLKFDYGNDNDTAYHNLEPIFENGLGIHSSWNAVAAFFDISHSDAEMLFQDEGYEHEQGLLVKVTPDEVAARIKEYLAGTLIYCDDDFERI